MDERETRAHEGGSDRSATHKAKEKAKEVTDQAREKVSHAASEARDKGEDLVDEGRDKARELGDRAGEMARDRADEQRSRVADGIRTVADALHRGARDLPEDRQQYGRFLDTVADRFENASRYLEEHDVQELTREVRRFARDHTPVFLSGAFTLGMLGARFLKSSPDDAGRERYGGGYPEGYGESYGGQRYAGYSRGERFGRYQPEDRYEGTGATTGTGATGAGMGRGTAGPEAGGAGAGGMGTGSPGTASGEIGASGARTGAERPGGTTPPRPTGPDRTEGIGEGGHA